MMHIFKRGLRLVSKLLQVGFLAVTIGTIAYGAGMLLTDSLLLSLLFVGGTFPVVIMLAGVIEEIT